MFDKKIPPPLFVKMLPVKVISPYHLEKTAAAELFSKTLFVIVSSEKAVANIPPPWLAELLRNTQFDIMGEE